MCEMNSPVGQLSAVAAMFQCSSNLKNYMRDKSIGRHLTFVAYSKENSGSYWTSTTVLNFRHKEHSLSSFFL